MTASRTPATKACEPGLFADQPSLTISLLDHLGPVFPQGQRALWVVWADLRLR